MDSSADNNNDRFLQLSLPDIAAWRENKSNQHSKTNYSSQSIHAVLPALQRGSVWSASQTEQLWDSLVRGFPVGSFLLSPYRDQLGRKKRGINAPEPTHHLLDGQQRANAIALGFYNPWEQTAKQKKRDSTANKYSRRDEPVLWVDLSPDSSASTELYKFHVVTRSHPWGYKKGTKQTEKLPVGQMRLAIQAFRYLSDDKQSHEFKLHEFPLAHAFPWDAKAPIPVCFLLNDTADNKDAAEMADYALESLQLLPFWKAASNLRAGNETPKAQAAAKFQETRRILRDLQARGGSDAFAHQLLGKMRDVRDQTKIPAIVFDVDVDDNADYADTVEMLFERINTAGTRLSSEEIKYSLLKTAWPKAPEYIEEHLIGKVGQIAKPARLVSLFTRLLVGIDEQRGALPGAHSISEFRKLVHHNERRFGEEETQTFRGRIEDFCKPQSEREHESQKTSDETILAEQILGETWSLLAIDSKDDDKDQRLPKHLAAGLSAAGSEDLLLVVMYWVWNQIKAGTPPSELPLHTRERTLGFLTAISWFAKDVTSCSRELWNKFPKEKADCDFFNSQRFSEMLKPKDNGALRMMPFPSPALLGKVFDDAKWGKKLDKAIWQVLFNNLHVEDLVKKNYRQIFKSLPIESPTNDQPTDDHLMAAWMHFVNWTWWYGSNYPTSKRLLDYAQRHQLTRWFGWFDPTQPDQINDHDRPWDYDHILPNKWVHGKHGINEGVRHAAQSIGNMRAWPRELNRSDQAIGPKTS